MAQHPFLKSIKPVNLLSFGPNTKEIELRPLNILIGPNGSGKSNLIEIIGLLSKLPDKDPWSTVIRTGGAREWLWKGDRFTPEIASVSIIAAANSSPKRPARAFVDSDPDEQEAMYYSISLSQKESGFHVEAEKFYEMWDGLKEGSPASERSTFKRLEGEPAAKLANWSPGEIPADRVPEVPPNRSALSMQGRELYFAVHHPRMGELANQLERFSFYREWIMGAGAKTRGLQPAGLDSYRLASDSINLAQVLKAWRDRGDSARFDRLVELMQNLYESVKDVDTELIGSSLRVMIKEEGLNSRTPAERLSDGTLRWLMLLIILLDPTPPPVICIEEPELGLHPDAIHTLADLLREASTRTQLIVTTHSDALVDAFSDNPEAVCVCEKVEGSTVIRRLEKERLKAWLKDYSLGHLWMSGEIGGNRW